MRLPWTESTETKSKIVARILCTIMVDAIIFCTGFELILYFSGGTTNGCAPLLNNTFEVPIIVCLTVLMLIHIILMIPGFIAGLTQGRFGDTGLFYMCLCLLFVEFVYFSFMAFDALIPWWLEYLMILLK